MNVGIVTQLAYPHDREVRGRKIATTLHKQGHKAFIICPKARDQSETEELDYATVCRFGYLAGIAWLNRFLSIAIPMNFLWTLWIFQLGKRKKLGLLIVRDIRLVFPAILAAKLLRIPIVWDMAENHVAATEILPKEKLWHYVIRNRKLISMIEKICVSLADYIWVVVQENKERLLRLGSSDEKIAVVSNTPIWASLNNEETNPLRGYKHDGKFLMLYVGKVTKGRGLELVVESMPYVVKEDDQIELLIVGDGPEKSNLENLARRLTVESFVKFTGWIESGDIPAIIKQGDVGLIPHWLNELTHTTIPNKLFDYMMAGVPVLATDMKPIRKIIQETNCGLIIPNTPQAVADLILKLKKSPTLRHQMGQNGLWATATKYNWSVESETITKTIERLCPTV